MNLRGSEREVLYLPTSEQNGSKENADRRNNNNRALRKSLYLKLACLKIRLLLISYPFSEKKTPKNKNKMYDLNQKQNF